MKKILVVFLIIVFLLTVFNYDNIRLIERKGDYYWTSVPYSPLAAKTDFTISYSYLNSLGGTVTKTYSNVYTQVEWEEVNPGNGDFGGNFGRPTLYPVGWVFIAFNSVPTDNFFYIDDVDIFTFRGGSFPSNRVLTSTQLLDVDDSMFSKPFEDGAYLENNIMYYANVQGWDIIDHIQSNLSSLEAPSLPGEGAGITEYFIFVIDELSYFTQCIGAVFSGFYNSVF